MILTSTGATTPWTPLWLCDDAGRPQPGAPVFHLRAGSVIERGQMEAELSGPHRAGQVWGFELRQAMRTGVVALLADDPELDRVLGLIDSEAEDGEVTLADGDKQLLAEVGKVLAEHWPEYRDLIAQLERRRAVAPIVALRRFCAGIEADGVRFARGRDGLVAEATLAQLDPLMLSLAGNAAYLLQQPRGLEKNSPPLSPSDDSPPPSSSDEPSTAAGRSAASAGERTPA